MDIAHAPARTARRIPRAVPSADAPRRVALATAVLTSLVTALFADWGTYTGPLAPIAPRLPAVSLPGRPAPASPALLVGVALLLAVPLLYAKAVDWRWGERWWRVLLVGWASLALAWLGAGAITELLRTAVADFGDGRPPPPVTEIAWSAFAQGAYGGLHGLLLGWPVAAALIPLVPRGDGPPAGARSSAGAGSPAEEGPPVRVGPSVRVGSPVGVGPSVEGGPSAEAGSPAEDGPSAEDGPEPSRGPYLWISAGMLAVPVAMAVGWPLLAPDRAPAECGPTACMTGQAGALFFSEIMLRLMLPVWAAAIAALAGLRRVPWFRRRRPALQTLVGTGFGGLAFLLSGMVGGG
ncbi:hypothetical protein SAMN04489712_102295 [Thermomonospora echinospora]|uniref:Uncharacterized protein n=1 Tax=Thermomonospora echinospora TaxID=1992 RepID=A0A1H5VF46_9ACTN|nr:hypothetical protein [Thermomonospora echinospora]SEF85830.1 hypothetical protein SAMN04489712_102295 [Thermomonospora echinospora]